MRIIAVITSPATFRQWAERQAHLGTLGADTAMGGTDPHDAWTAHRVDSFDVPWQGEVHEVVMLPADGGAAAQPRDLLPKPPVVPPRPAPIAPPPPVPAETA